MRGLVIQKGNLPPGIVSREEPTPCCRLPGQHGTIHTPQARSFTNRKRRKSSRPIYDAVSPLEEQEQDIILRSIHKNAIRPNNSGTLMWTPPYLDMRAPEWHSGENLAGYR